MPTTSAANSQPIDDKSSQPSSTGNNEEKKYKTLLVPIELEAWVANDAIIDADKRTGGLRRWTLDYDRLTQFSSPMPSMQTDPLKVNKAKLGVYLHWTLPPGLRQAVQADNRGPMQFPCVPNRWLLVRYYGYPIKIMSSRPAHPAPNSYCFFNEASTWKLIKTSSNLKQPPVEILTSTVTDLDAALVNKKDITSLSDNNKINIKNKIKAYQSTQPFDENKPFTERLAAAWIIESDYYDNLEGTSSYPHPKQVGQTRIGRWWRLQEWDEAILNNPQNFLDSLTAVSSGDVHFTAYQPYNENVFSFHDPVTDVEDVDSLSYFVTSWYANILQDPLPGYTKKNTTQSFSEYIKQYKWSAEIKDEKNENKPLIPVNRILCHGMVYDVQWNKTGFSSSPNAEGVHIAVGSNLMEALAGLVSSSKKDAIPANLLQAFTGGLLDKLEASDADETVTQHLHHEEFGSESSREAIVRPTSNIKQKDENEDDSLALGVAWTIAASDGEAKGDVKASVLNLPAVLASMVDELNKLQLDLDMASRTLEKLQWDLYALWWKQGYLAQGPHAWPSYYMEGFGKGLATKIFPVKVSVAMQKNKVEKLATQVFEKKQEIKQQIDINNGSDIYVASSLSNKDFYQAYIYIKSQGQLYYRSESGATEQIDISKIDKSFDEVMSNETKKHLTYTQIKLITSGSSHTRKDKLLWTLKSIPQASFWYPRDPVLLVANLQKISKPESSVKAESKVENLLPCRYLSQRVKISDEGKLATLISLLDFGKLPVEEEILGLLIEFLLLEPYVINNNLDSMSSSGKRPIYGLKPWSQPWTPILLEWETCWYPLPFVNWQFDGERYVLNKMPSDHHQQTLSGCDFLNLDATYAFKRQIKNLIEQNPKKFTDSKELLKTIDDWQVLAVSLGGFHERLVQRDVRINRIPHRNAEIKEEVDIAVLVGEQAHCAPLPGAMQDPYSFDPPLSTFQPVRHGQFYFKQLRIVDRFGQTIGFTDSKDTPILPNISEALLPDYEESDTKNLLTVESYVQERFMQLTPRVVQPLRLNVDWLDANDDTKTLATYCKTNPVIGWILPNYLDQGLQIYDPDGNSLGELQLSSDTTVNWEASYNCPYVTPAAMKDKHPWLSSILKIFVPENTANDATSKDPADPVKAFNAFREVIEQAIASKASSDSQYAHYLAALVGRPLALARARWGLKLAQPAYSDQSWYQSSTEVSSTYSYYNFPVQLGNTNLNQDGLIGYFLKKPNEPKREFSSFYSLYSCSTENQNTYTYPTTINRFSLKPCNPGQDEFQITTILMDPFAKVHAYTDILPVQSLQLPSYFIKKALDQMQVTFRHGPLLASRVLSSDEVPIEMIRLITPSAKGNWSWLDPQIDGTDKWKEIALQKVDMTARFEEQDNEIVEGLLKFSLFSDNQSNKLKLNRAKLAPIAQAMNAERKANLGDTKTQTKDQPNKKETEQKRIVSAAASVPLLQATPAVVVKENLSKWLACSTQAYGDCAFHSIFGELKGDMFEYKDVAASRKQLAQAIRATKEGDELYRLVKAGIEALIMDSETIRGNLITKLRDGYLSHVAINNIVVEQAWLLFEAKLKQYPEILSYVQQTVTEQDVRIKNLKTLKDQFHFCLNKSQGNLKIFIQLEKNLDEAFNTYNQKVMKGFALSEKINGDVINEYANFLEKTGNWLLPLELNLIAYVFNIKVVLYTRNWSQGSDSFQLLDTYNPGQVKTVEIRFNGINHYERMVLNPKFSVDATVSGDSKHTSHSSTAITSTAPQSFTNLGELIDRGLRKG